MATTGVNAVCLANVRAHGSNRQTEERADALRQACMNSATVVDVGECRTPSGDQKAAAPAETQPAIPTSRFPAFMLAW